MHIELTNNTLHFFSLINTLTKMFFAFLVHVSWSVILILFTNYFFLSVTKKVFISLILTKIKKEICWILGSLNYLLRKLYNFKTNALFLIFYRSDTHLFTCNLIGKGSIVVVSISFNILQLYYCSFLLKIFLSVKTLFIFFLSPSLV